MSESLVNYKIGHEKQILFLNQERIVGAQSIQSAQNFGLAGLSYVGIGNKALNYVPRTEQSNNFSINSYLINKDYFFSLTTGNFLSNIYLLRSKTELDTCFSAISGYFNQFNCSYNIGGVPETNVNFVALFNAGSIPTGQLPSDCLTQLSGISTSNIEITGALLIPYSNSISLTINDLVSTNRVQSFNLQVNSNKQPLYFAGSKYPRRVELLSSDVQLNLTFQLGDYECKKLRDIPTNNSARNLSIQINDYSTNQAICTYSIPNMVLVNEEYSNSVNGMVEISQSYNTKLF